VFDPLGILPPQGGEPRGYVPIAAGGGSTRDQQQSGEGIGEMTIIDMAEVLSALAQLDIDAIRAYEQAIESVSHGGIRVSLTRFRDDHKRHVEHLSAVIRALDAVPPEYSPDLKGFLIEGFTAIQSLLGTEGALVAMRNNEELTNRKYAEAYEMNLSPNIRELVGHNYHDEQVHLKYIQEMLASRAWEK